MRTTDTGVLTIKVPVSTDLTSKPFSALIASLVVLSIFFDVALEVAVGESISPIAVSGDIELERAEEIKQRALVHVRAWEAEKNPNC